MYVFKISMNTNKGMAREINVDLQYIYGVNFNRMR
jgi:hypothetical protein